MEHSTRVSAALLAARPSRRLIHVVHVIIGGYCCRSYDRRRYLLLLQHDDIFRDLGFSFGGGGGGGRTREGEECAE
jgi:hypothetical protein